VALLASLSLSAGVHHAQGRGRDRASSISSGYTLGFTRGAELFEYRCQENNLSPESMVGDALSSTVVP
jgi:hypothetical protein